MRWHHYVAYFFGGAFLANTLPHLGNGISGHPFQSPFASPPGEGLSSSTVNVLWGLFNLAVGYLRVCRVGRFDLRKTQHVLVLGAGILIMSILLARGFGRFHGCAGEKLVLDTIARRIDEVGPRAAYPNERSDSAVTPTMDWAMVARRESDS
jgi:hypothetical protein